MQKNNILIKTIPFAAAGLLFALGILLLIPTTSRGIFELLGIDPTRGDIPVYNGFEPFVPYVPGYFPEDFDITHVSNSAHLSTEINTYTETYASETHFFQLIESQGPSVPVLTPAPDLTIQDQRAGLSEGLDLTLSPENKLDLSQFDTGKSWTVTFVLNEIYIQVATNLPREEAFRVAEGLVPAICTTKPTPEG